MGDTDTIGRLESQIEILKTRLGQAEAAVKSITRERDQAVAARYIDAAARTAGVQGAKAIEDVVNRALDSGDWIKDRRTGKLVRHSDDYPDVDMMSGGNLTIEKFLNGLRNDPEASHYWSGGGSRANGGGNGNSAPGATPNVPNPWVKESWDDMEQARVYRADPAKAAALAAAAGSYVGALKPD